ncbi:MAG TPA: DUF169 domain-containing protein [Dehalococcoidales bacterium]|nr:DUF169 domain-containing protein [Dehalococcoidales bacterium]
MIRDYSILDKFNFDYPPVGVKYSLEKPKRIEQLGKSIALCELFKEAQTSQPFYVTKENIQCGDQILGMSQFPPLMHSGSLGSMFSMFKNAQANARIYEYMPLLSANSVNYASFAPLKKLKFDPDILIITASVAQAEVILRASTYDTGKMWSNKGTTCLACAWMYAYPYLTGEINYTISGLGFSMKARGVLPDGLFIFSVPNDKILPLIDNLNDMEWHPDWFDMGREGFIEAVTTRSKELGKKLGAPSYSDIKEQNKPGAIK